MASVPELTSRTISIDGTACTIISASSISPAVGAPNEKPARGGLLHRLDDVTVPVPEDHRPPGADTVDVLEIVDVEDARTLRGLDEQRRAAHAAKRPHRRVHAAGDDFLCTLKEGFGMLGHKLRADYRGGEAQSLRGSKAQSVTNFEPLRLCAYAPQYAFSSLNPRPRS